ncbi:MAG: hypothetical protein Kow0068_18980 [Marinilabiliales bacterium]
MRAKSTFSVFFLFIVSAIFAQTPTIKWHYDINDSSFGISAAADLDFDGYLELAFSCYRNDCTIYVLNAEDGSLLWKYNTGGCNDVAPLIYDVDMDDTLEVILPSSCNPTTFCFNGPDGTIEWTTSLHGSDSPPTVGDLDNDGKPEILHGNFGGWVTCLNGEDGSINFDLPVDLNSWIQTAPVILDADNDGQLDFIVGNWSFDTLHTVKCYRGDNQQLLWTSYLPNDVMYHGSAFADIDNDGYQEIILGDYSGQLMVLNAENGSLKWNYYFSSPYYIGSPVSIGDLNNDGYYEIVFFDAWRLGVLSHTGSLLWDFNIPGYASAFRGAALSDVNNDDTLDVVFGTSDGIVYALNGSQGNQLWNIDLWADYGDTLEFDHAPVISDFDKDGYLDFFIVGGKTNYPNISGNYGRAYAVSMNSSGGPDWLMFQRDSVRSSRVPIDSALVIKNNNLIDYKIECFPNPAKENFTIEYKLPAAANVKIEILNITGQVNDIIIDKYQLPGSYIIRYENKFKSCVFLLQFNVNNNIINKKIVIY